MMSSFNFSDFANILYFSFANGESKAKFSRSLFENITNFDKCSGVDPLCDLDDLTYKSYFNGTRQLTRLAPKIISYIDVKKFAKYINDNIDVRLNHSQNYYTLVEILIEKLTPYCDVQLDIDNIAEQAAFLFHSIILASCEKWGKRKADKSVVNRVTLASQARSVAKGEKNKENITDKIKIAELFDSTQDYTFDFQQFRTFTSCGNESSVFKGVFKIEKPANYISLIVNFEKTRLRNEIPEYAGVYFLKRPPIDISTRNMICFQARSVDESVQTIFLELKPEGKRWMHESFSFCVSSEWQKYVIDLTDTDFLFPETLECLEEVTFVIKPNSFANEDRLAGKLDLAELYIK